MNSPLTDLETYWHIYARVFQKFVQGNEGVRCKYFISIKVLRRFLLELCADAHDTHTRDAVEILHTAVKNMYNLIKNI